jgi:UbiD family decarboxylase
MPADLEVTAILEQLYQRKRFPTVLFEKAANVKGEDSRFKLLTNLFATRERCAIAVDLDPSKSKMELNLELSRRESQKISPVIVSKETAPIKEEIRTGDQVDLNELPIVKHYEMDPGPYLDMTVSVKDPESGFYNISFQRNQLKGPRKLGIFMSRRHNWFIFKKYEDRGKPCPTAITIGHHPAFYLGTFTLAPFGINEYEICGGMLKEPVRLVESETWGKDFLVPADAEIVIEGELIPNVRDPEGPFGEYTGYYGPELYSQCPIINVKAMTYRKDAIYQDIYPGKYEHRILGGPPRESGVYDVVKARVPNVKAVHFPVSGCCRFLCYVSIKKTNEGDPKMAALAALGRDEMIKYIVIVDDDIDVFDEERVLWAVATRTLPDLKIDIIRDVKSDTHDPSLTKPDLGSKAIVDATKPLHRPFAEEIKVSTEVLERIKLEDWFKKEAW